MKSISGRWSWLASLCSQLLVAACHSPTDAADAFRADGGVLGASLRTAFVLELSSEKKLSKLLPSKELDHYEASGIVAANGSLFVAFDNTTQIARIDTSLQHGNLGPGAATQSQYEALTATDDGRFFAMTESVNEADTRGEVAELATDTSATRRSFIELMFQHANKGFEGLAWLRKDGSERLLALCENNDCMDDDSMPGEGRVQVLSFDGAVWANQASLELPESVEFLNYSDLALRDLGSGAYAAAIVSKKSSALWVGRLTSNPWAFSGPGQFYVFPREPDGSVSYCSVEGVTFLGPTVLAMASDKTDLPAPCSEREQSIHVFQLPQ